VGRSQPSLSVYRSQKLKEEYLRKLHSQIKSQQFSEGVSGKKLTIASPSGPQAPPERNPATLRGSERRKES